MKIVQIAATVPHCSKITFLLVQAVHSQVKGTSGDVLCSLLLRAEWAARPDIIQGLVNFALEISNHGSCISSLGMSSSLNSLFLYLAICLLFQTMPVVSCPAPCPPPSWCLPCRWWGLLPCPAEVISAQLPSASPDKANVALPIICAELSPGYLCLPSWKAQTRQVLST